MQAQFPQGFGQTAALGDVLYLGLFKMPGSPARDKEPFHAFRSVRDPSRIAHICRGYTLLIQARRWPQYDGRIAWIETHCFDVRSIRMNLEPELCFLHSNERVALSALPIGTDCRFTVIYAAADFRAPHER